jgi:excisionase family DNA binding protein
MARKADETSAGDRLAYTIPQVAALVNISRASIYRQMTAGKLASVKIGKSRRVTLAALGAWIASAPAA